MPALDEFRMGRELSPGHGWSSKDGTAAEYKSGGSDYRTYRPTVTNASEGGLSVSTKIDHIRGFMQDDHCQLEVTFDSEGGIVTVSAIMKFADIPQFDPVLVEKAVAAAGLKGQAAAAKVAADVANSLVKFITNVTEHGGTPELPSCR